MTIDGPSPVVPVPVPVARTGSEKLRYSLGGVRQAAIGIELTLVALLVVLLGGPSGLTGLGAAILGGGGLILVLTGLIEPGAESSASGVEPQK
jgi:hypothetical protein